MRTVPVKVFNGVGQLVGPLDLPRVEKTDAEWQAQLTPDQFRIDRGDFPEPGELARPRGTLQGAGEDAREGETL